VEETIKYVNVIQACEKHPEVKELGALLSLIIDDFSVDGFITDAALMKVARYADSYLKADIEGYNHALVRYTEARNSAWALYTALTHSNRGLIHPWHVKETITEPSEHALGVYAGARYHSLECYRSIRNNIEMMKRSMQELNVHIDELEVMMDAYPIEDMLELVPSYPANEVL
jgi:hypothetical protein